MKLDAETLRRLSPLLDTGIDLAEAERETWLSGLSADDALLVPMLRDLLTQKSIQTKVEVLERGVNFSGFELGSKEDAVPLSAGDTAGPYRLIRELGRGGMGTVWLAARVDGTLNREIALKLPHTSRAMPQLAERFSKERDILSALVHPHIARLYDAGVTSEGRPYLALEYVDGESIETYCNARKLSIVERLKLFMQVLSAVQYAHNQLVIHRDLKPSNVLVTTDGEVRLLDFGIAKLLTAGTANEAALTQLGGTALTLQYAAPEQILGQTISTAVDVYALGIMLYELLTGTLPYRPKRDSPGAVENAILETETVAPSRVLRGASLAPAQRKLLRGDLDTIILKALKKSPQERYATVAALADDLQRFMRGEPVLAQADSAGYRVRKFVGRHRLAVGAATLVGVALIAFIVILDYQVHKVTRERDRADRLAEFMTDTFKVADPSEERSQRVTARELLDAAARNMQSGLDSDPELRARLVRTMGLVYSGLGAMAQSEDLLRAEYERARKAMGDEHPATLSVATELVHTFAVRLKSAEAETLARDLLARQRRLFGAQSRETAETESYLGYTLSNLGRFDEAVALESHSQQVLRSLLPEDDPRLLNRKADLAYFMLRSGKTDPHQAEQLFREIIAAYGAKPGTAKIKTLRASNGLASVLTQQKRFTEQVPLLRQALEEAGKELKPEHPQMRDALNNLAGALINSGDLEQAQPVLIESIAVNQKVEGVNSPRAAIAEYNLACVKARRGDRQGALDLLFDAVDHGLIGDAALQMEDESDLISLRGDARFAQLLKTVKAKFGAAL